MKLHRKDLIWISILGLAFLFFLNIFIHPGPRRQYQLTPHPVYHIPGLNQANKPLVFLSEDTSLDREDNDGTPLPFELQGTIIGRTSLAFIYNSHTNTRAVYKLNDIIGDFKIQNIRPAKVLLAKGDTTRELLLAGESRGDVSDEKGIIFTDAAGTKSVSRSGLVSLMFQANELLRTVKILPVSDTVSHALLGFSIENVPAGSIIEEAGIKNGDIIHSVEGRRLQSAQDAMQMLGAIRKQSSFEVVLLRQDRPVIVRYELRN
ncbi:MAG: hypothetical protein Q7J72_06005 [Candidatus Omnitrophota bacterium]|nr:hypothetical protein [Candidatus Omnitrophota bacterium]